MAELEFQKMDVGDIPAVAELERQLFSCPWSRQAFLDTLNQDTLFVTARIGDAIAGYCGMYCYAGKEGEITNVAVSPRFQNQGIGRRMLTYLLEQACGRGMTRIVLEVRVSNAAAMALYLRCGFVGVAVRPRYYGDGEDALVMQLEKQA